MITEEWLKTIKQVLIFDEGIKYYPYEDGTATPARARPGAGFITIGVGRNLETVGVSLETILMMLEEDIEVAVSYARIIFKSDFEGWDTPRQHAIVCMLFNLGFAGFSKFKNMIEALREEDWATAARHAEDSLWYKQVKSRGKRIVKLIRDGEYDYPHLDSIPIRSC